eukprot:5260144-Pyramimonas_sp.AAC.1
MKTWVQFYVRFEFPGSSYTIQTGYPARDFSVVAFSPHYFTGGGGGERIREAAGGPRGAVR